MRPDAAGGGATERIRFNTPQNITGLDFYYAIVRVWKIPAERFLEGGVALLPLAPIAKVAKSKVKGIWQQIKTRLAQILPQSQEKKLRTATYILMGLKYEQTFIDHVMEGVVEMRESVTYQAILREGEEIGIEKGEAKALHATILLLGENALGRRPKPLSRQ